MRATSPIGRGKNFFDKLENAFCILHFYSTPLKYSPLVQAPGSKGAGSR